MVSSLQTVSVFLLNASFSWLVGSWLARSWLKAAVGTRTSLQARFRRADIAAAALGLISCGAALLAATAVMGGVGLREACPMLGMMLTNTAYGHAGCVATVAIISLLAIRASGKAGCASQGLAAVSLLVFAVSRASMGHAGDEGFFTVVFGVEAVHLLAIGTWVGVVLVSAWRALNAARAHGAAGGAGQYLEMMSHASLIAVVAIVVTGIYSAWHRVGTYDALLNSSYGAILLAKVTLVIAALAMGAYNKFFGVPSAQRNAADLGRVRAVLRIESIVLLGALFAAAVLTSEQPPTSL